MYFSAEPPKLTLMRAPGTATRASRSCCSTACFLTPPRSERGVRFRVSVALRTSGLPLPMNGSAPVAPPPTVV